MSYDTALPRSSFISQQLVSLVSTFAGFSTLFGLSFMAAESLTRRAFGHHPQFWRTWSRPAAASTAIAGRTLGGYLLVAVFFAYDVLLYFYATRWFGWWTPSDALIHPDVLATYLPWLSAIANAFQAGFWEEALFRAVPIAGAAIIGEHFGRRRLFIIIAFIVQTIVFGAGHAPYPTQPSYARPVELILPSVGFGLLYLRFGLLPGIILHYAFDVIWMALPLFVSSASGVWLDRTIVIVLTMVPLWIVLGARIRSGAWHELPEEERNRSWTPPPLRVPSRVVVSPEAAGPISPRLVRGWLVAGIAALVVWSLVQPFGASLPPLSVSRADAARIAREALAARGVTLGPEWRVMPAVDNGRGAAHEFVWSIGGKDRFQALLGRYLPRPRWIVRFASFEGDVDKRAEEWRVLINHRGEAERIAHQLPESSPGATLTEADARALALAEVKRVIGLDGPSLREISAQPSKLTARTDWLFTFEDLTVDAIPLRGEDASSPDARGEARINVLVSGDEVTQLRTFVRIPEAWQRQRRAQDTFSQIVSIFATLIAGGALATAAITGIIAWSRRRGFSRPTLIAIFAVFVATSLVGLVNQSPSALASLSTARPFGLQIAMLVGVGLVGLLLPGTMVALAAGSLPSDMPKRRILTTPQLLALGASLGVIAAAAGVLIRASGPPPWPDVDALASYVPFLAWSLERVPALLLRAVTLLALLTVVDDFTDGWTTRRAVFGIGLIVAGAVLGVPTGSLSVPQWAVAGAAVGSALLCAYVFVLRHDLSIGPLVMATAVSLAQIRDGVQTGLTVAIGGSLVGAALTVLTAWWMVRQLQRERDGGAALG
jgi:hypothetical protein